VLRVPLSTGLRLASELFARTVMTDRAACASFFIAVVDLSGEGSVLFDADGTHAQLEPASR